MFLLAPSRRLLNPLSVASDAGACLLHTSASSNAQLQSKRGGFGLKGAASTSHKKLATDLTPRSKGKGAGTLEVAPGTDRRSSGPYRGRQSSESDDKPKPQRMTRASRSPPRPDFVRDVIPHPERPDAETRPAGVPGRSLIDEELRPSRRADSFVARRAFEQRGADRHRRDHEAFLERQQARAQIQGRQNNDERQPAGQRAQAWDRRDDGEQQPAARRPPSSRKFSNPLSIVKEEFDISTRSDQAQLAKRFTSPPLLPGLVTSLHELLGPDAQPSPIQALALKHLISETPPAGEDPAFRQFLLASETGSGKSIAYLLPLLQALKQTEGANPAIPTPRKGPLLSTYPRALVLAPTHELARQLSMFAKALTHVAKLRVLCASRANEPNTGPRLRGMSASKMSGAFDGGGRGAEFTVNGATGARARPVDVLVATPMKVLEMTRGRGWNKTEGEGPDGRAVTVGEPEMGFENVEWVIVDEADVLFDPDFQETTRMLLADISAARGHPIPAPPVEAEPSTEPTPLNYPFNLVLTSATIPSSLATYLDTHHPTLTRLASPKLHRLPASLKTEHVPYTGGNRLADIEHRLREVWAEDSRSGRPRSKVLVFCNRGTKVEELGRHLTDKGIENVAVCGNSDARRRGSNRHLAGFLKPVGPLVEAPSVSETPTPVKEAAPVDAALPHVLITTSLLSRGLDFAPDIRHVFIADSPRNMIDFLHRAGRSGRAGQEGKVVVFGKLSGRGSDEARGLKRKVRAFAS